MSRSLLAFRVGERRCAIPVEAVEETMRPLPLEPFPGTPDLVVGAAVVRGRIAPIVDPGVLLGDGPTGGASRWITVRLPGERRVGLLASEVLGVVDRSVDPADASAPLLGDAAALEALGRLDGELLAVLRLGRIVSDEVWQALAEQGTSR
jgi:purine-binding chemotaxis protein CheW